MATKQSTKQGSKNVLFILTYLLTWLTGIIIYITEGQKDARLKFHALQAIFLGVIATIVGWVVPLIGGLVALLLWLYGMYMGYKAYDSNEDISAPVLGDLAKQYSK